ncbi:MAG: hypothetical protein ACKO34_05900 [Vampirovibrionales bacterium]
MGSLKAKSKKSLFRQQAGYQRLFIVEGDTEEALLKTTFGVPTADLKKVDSFKSIATINPDYTDIQNLFKVAKGYTQRDQRTDTDDDLKKNARLKKPELIYDEAYIVFDGDVILKDPQHQHKLTNVERDCQENQWPIQFIFSVPNVEYALAKAFGEPSNSPDPSRYESLLKRKYGHPDHKSAQGRLQLANALKEKLPHCCLDGLKQRDTSLGLRKDALPSERLQKQKIPNSNLYWLHDLCP